MNDSKKQLKLPPLSPCDTCESDDADDCDICNAYKRYSDEYDRCVDLLDITDDEKILLKKPFFTWPHHSFENKEKIREN